MRTSNALLVTLLLSAATSALVATVLRPELVAPAADGVALEPRRT